MNPLQGRLAALRRRLRTVVLWRGTGWLLAVVVGGAAVAGLLDWSVHLPAPVRALVLVGTLAAAGYLGRRHLIAPLAAGTDDLSRALQEDAQHPILTHTAASA